MEKSELDSIKKQCMDKWGQKDEKVEQFEMNFDQWSIFSNDEDGKICLDLLKKFDYYSKQKVNIELKEMHKELLGILGFNSDYTIYTIIKHRNGRINSSMEYFWEYTHMNQIESDSCIEDISSINDEEYRNVKNVVIIDDCIGSGRTTKDFLEKYKARLIGKKIYLILVHLVIESACKLANFAEKNGYKLTILCRNKREKVFSKEEDSEIKEKFVALSESRKIPKKYILGDKHVEALMAFYNNTPNNTLGIFWYKTEKNAPLFLRRKDRRSSWRLKESKVERKQQNYMNRGIDL